MSIVPAITVAPPVTPAGRRYSIIEAAGGPLDLPRLAGVQYQAPWCTAATAEGVDCASPGELVEGPGPEWVTGEEFQVIADLSCLAPGTPWADREGIPGFRSMLLAKLEATEHVAVEEHVADALAAAGAVNVGASASVVAAVGALEKHAYTTERYGLKATIHAAMNLGAAMDDRYQGDVRIAPRWETRRGTVVYWNAGLPDNTMYITGALTLWRSVGPSFITEEATALDRVTNEWKGFAISDWAAAWECFTGVTTVAEEA